jgi:hypothetical protein
VDAIEIELPARGGKIGRPIVGDAAVGDRAAELGGLDGIRPRAEGMIGERAGEVAVQMI